MHQTHWRYRFLSLNPEPWVFHYHNIHYHLLTWLFLIHWQHNKILISLLHILPSLLHPPHPEYFPSPTFSYTYSVTWLFPTHEQHNKVRRKKNRNIRVGAPFYNAFYGINYRIVVGKGCCKMGHRQSFLAYSSSLIHPIQWISPPKHSLTLTW